MEEKEKQSLSSFILEQLKGIGKTVSKNYKANQTARTKNPFLCFSKGIDKFMGLGRSIDSQLGSRMQNIIFYLCRLRYGAENVPNLIYVNADKGKSEILLNLYYIEGQLSVKDFYAQKNPCKQKVFLNHSSSKDEAKQILGVKKSKKEDLIKSTTKTFTASVETVDDLLKEGTASYPVDLFFINTANGKHAIHTFEIKMSGYIDTKNAESNVNEVNRLFKTFSFSKENASSFAVCYGECADAVKNKMELLAPECQTMTAEKFWELVLPTDNPYELSYSEFKAIYKKAFQDSDLENTIKELK